MSLQADKLKQRIAAVTLLLLALALVGALVVRPIWARYAANRDRIADLEQTVARFESIATRQAGLERRLETVRRSINLDELTLRADSATLAAADLQEQVKAAVQAAGGSLTSTQILEPEKVSSFERISVNVRMTGTTQAVQESLYALESGQPVLAIDDLLVVARRTTVRLGARRTAEQDWLDVRFKVSGFYEHDPAQS
ncbi:MAG TPA: type II secretion system protein GspM [Gammaproteobacteria bacterium]|nr:type II secretion system protein GspM [Gammaproteobacteria bacterium]